MIKKRNLDSSLITWIRGEAGLGLLGLLGAGAGVDSAKAETYYVSKNGSDSWDGLTPDTPFLTVDKANDVMNARINWSASPWAQHDVMFIFPGKYAENLTALPYGCSVVGLGNAFDINGENGVTIDPASGSAFDATSMINTQLFNVCFEAPDTSAIFQADNLNRNRIIGCVFQGLPGASPTTTRGLEVVKDMTGTWVEDCWFNQIRNGVYIVTDNANSKQATGDMFRNLTILGGDQTGMYFDANCNPTSTIIDGCNIAGAGATLALGLDDNTGIVTVMNTNFEATACDPASGDGDSKYNNCYLNGSLIT